MDVEMEVRNSLFINKCFRIYKHLYREQTGGLVKVSAKRCVGTSQKVTKLLKYY